MRGRVSGLSAALLAALAAVPAMAQGVRCDRGDLARVRDVYLAAQAAGDPIKLPLADFTAYSEQMEDATLFGGAIAKPMKIGLSRSILDVPGCTTFVLVIADDAAAPRVIGARLQFSGRDNPIAPSRTNDIETIVTGPGDWLFDGPRALAAAKAEDWREIPEADRDNRAAIVAAADAYLDALGRPGVPIPWAASCERIEGGAVFGRTGEACDAGLPGNLKARDRRYIVDESIGAVAVLLTLGDAKFPDVHIFRVEKGRIRYVHALTVCRNGTCAQPATDALKARIAG